MGPGTQPITLWRGGEEGRGGRLGGGKWWAGGRGSKYEELVHEGLERVGVEVWSSRGKANCNEAHRRQWRWTLDRKNKEPDELGRQEEGGGWEWEGGKATYSKAHRRHCALSCYTNTNIFTNANINTNLKK